MPLPPSRSIRGSRDRGVVLPLFALLLTTMFVMVSFAVDLGRLRAERRDVQADADAIALDAVQKISGLTTGPALTAAITEANLSAARNGFPANLTAAEVQVGHWDVANQELDGTGADEYPDAVQVDLSSTIPMYFDLSSDERSVTRTGVAVARAQTRGRLGSVFSGAQLYDPDGTCQARAAVDAQLTYMNHLYTEYFDIEVSGGVGAAPDTGTIDCSVTGPSDGLQLDALSYQGLAFTEISLDEIAAQFAGASPEQLATSRVTASDFFSATADALDARGNTGDAEAAATFRSIATGIDSESDSSSEFEMGDVLTGSSPGDCRRSDGDDDPTNDGEPVPCAGNVSFNALQLLGVTAMAIDGENFATVDVPINIPLVDGTVISPRISIIETPQVDGAWRFAGQNGPRTAQLKIAVDIPLTGIGLDTSLLGILGVGGITPVDGNIPLVIEVARADSLYERVACSPNGIDGAVVDMLVETGAVSIGFGAVTDAELQESDDVTLTSSSMLEGSISLGLPGLGLLPGTNVSIDLAAVTDVTAHQTYEAGVKYAGGHDANINLLGAGESHGFTSQDVPPATDHFPSEWYRYDGGLTGTSITDSTFSSVTFNAVSSGTLSKLITYGASQASVENMIRSALQPVISEIGSEYVDTILSSLGITLAGADGRIDGVRCQVPALANRG